MWKVTWMAQVKGSWALGICIVLPNKSQSPTRPGKDSVALVSSGSRGWYGAVASTQQEGRPPLARKEGNRIRNI